LLKLNLTPFETQEYHFLFEKEEQNKSDVKREAAVALSPRSGVMTVFLEVSFEKSQFRKLY
jgi:hypothetical protein